MCFRLAYLHSTFVHSNDECQGSAHLDCEYLAKAFVTFAILKKFWQILIVNVTDSERYLKLYRGHWLQKELLNGVLLLVNILFYLNLLLSISSKTAQWQSNVQIL